MAQAVIVISGILIFLSVLPFIQHQHWIFRIAEFMKLQLLLVQVIVFAAAFFFLADHPVL